MKIFRPACSAFTLALLALLSSCSHTPEPEKFKGDTLDRLAAHKSADYFGVNGIRNEAGVGKIVFANPPGKFELPLDGTVKSVQFGFGISAAALTNTPPPQGVEFRLSLKKGSEPETLLWSKKLTPVENAADRGVQHASVPLSGTTSDKLIFETVALHDPVACWAFWTALTLQ